MSKSKSNKRLIHRLFLLFIILLIPAFMLKEHRIILAKKDTKVLPAPDFFQAELVENSNKTFVFIVLTNNNSDAIEENFRSIRLQEYMNFRVVYIDNQSTDGTAAQIQDLITKYGEGKRFKLVQVAKTYETYKAYFDTISKCDSDEVVVHISGSDFLAHNQVLGRLSRAYTNPDVWLTYGQYFEYHNYKKGILEAKPQKSVYKKRVQRAPWMLASLKTFYAGHFNNIRQMGSLGEEFFLSMEGFQALHAPLVEMGKAHVQFIPDVLYIHTQKTPRKRKKIKLARRAETITRTVHQALPMQKECSVDLIVFASGSHKALCRNLDSIQKHVSNLGKISVILASEDNLDARLCFNYPEVRFVETKADFKSAFMKTLMGSKDSSSYIILTSDQVMVQEDIALMPCIEAMRKTRAYGFYFHLGRQDNMKESHGIYSWSINKAKGPWRDPDTLKMALYRKIDLEKEFKEVNFEKASDLIDFWAHKKQSSAFGLAYDHSPLTIETHR